jgi:prepilin-type N-terminal cleavage/methylation domain-containing protein/prepilin-type processing-associated H-X9-DG protein
MDKQKAFTLIELLVVIAIIGLVMAVLLPTLHRVRRQAKAAVCQANLKQWATTLALYAEDHQGRFPRQESSTIWILTGRDPQIPSRLAGEFPADSNTPTKYHPIGTKGMLCPMATRPGDAGGFGLTYRRGGTSWSFKVTFGTTFSAWVLREPGPPLCVSYGLNRWLFDRPVDFAPFAPPPPSYTDIYSLRHAAGTPLLLDARTNAGLPRDEAAPPPYADAFPAQTRMTPFCINRHNGYVNCLFLDWSVRKVGLKELWTLKWDKDFNTAGPWARAGGVKPDDWPEWIRRFKEY